MAMIRGFTGVALGSGEDTNASYGVRPSGAQNNITVRDNIIRRVAIGFRGDGASQSNLITENLFDSVGFFDFGYAVSLRTQLLRERHQQQDDARLDGRAHEQLLDSQAVRPPGSSRTTRSTATPPASSTGCNTTAPPTPRSTAT